MKLNKFIAGIMTVCVMGFGVPYVNTVMENNSVITASAEEEKDYTIGTYENLTYKNYGDYIEIYRCDRMARDVVIPAEIDGVPVTSIGDGAFIFCYLKSIEISDSVISIGIGAFASCGSLTSVNIPDSVTSIGDGAFQNSNNLISVNIPDSVTSIEDRTFAYCDNLTSIEIPDSVTSIGYGAFGSCYNLTSITIPDSVTSIGSEAFSYCSSLTSIEIPDSVMSIGGNAFAETLWLEEKRKENPLVIVNNILLDGKTCTGDVIIPDNVTSIAGYAFHSCDKLTSIEIPDSVTSIEESTFWDCSSLTSIKIPDSVTSIGDYAFQYCSSLTSIEIPDSVTSISVEAFGHCTSLKEITILNPECDIFDDDCTISDLFEVDEEWNVLHYYNGTIRGYENSTAQAYAEKYGYKFEAIDKSTENIKGDINGDGDVNVADVVLLQKYILGGQEITEEQFKNADLNGDSYVDSFDMVLLRKQIINK